jgi:hypothetical protein
MMMMMMMMMFSNISEFIILLLLEMKYCSTVIVLPLNFGVRIVETDHGRFDLIIAF